MSTLSVGTIQSNTTSPPTINNSAGTAIGTFCRAWVNFNGTGTVAIRASFNVTSITDNNTGNYTVNLTTAMADANYVMESSASTVSNITDIRSNVVGGSSGGVCCPAGSSNQTTSSCKVLTGFADHNVDCFASSDCETVFVSIFR